MCMYKSVYMSLTYVINAKIERKIKFILICK